MLNPSKILILRTIAHSKVWDGNEPSCHYEDQNYDFIKSWEPNLLHYTIDEIKYGVGIYTNYYYNYKTRYGNKVHRGTIEEDQPSFLEIISNEENSRLIGVDNDSKIQIYFKLLNKYPQFSRTSMLELDNQLVKMKKNELGANLPYTRFDSLCFTLDFKGVEELFKSFNINLLS